MSMGGRAAARAQRRVLPGHGGDHGMPVPMRVALARPGGPQGRSSGCSEGIGDRRMLGSQPVDDRAARGRPEKVGTASGPAARATAGAVRGGRESRSGRMRCGAGSAAASQEAPAACGPASSVPSRLRVGVPRLPTARISRPDEPGRTVPAGRRAWSLGRRVGRARPALGNARRRLREAGTRCSDLGSEERNASSVFRERRALLRAYAPAGRMVLVPGTVLRRGSTPSSAGAAGP